jgi:hypothetical protein
MFNNKIEVSRQLLLFSSPAPPDEIFGVFNEVRKGNMRGISGYCQVIDIARDISRIPHLGRAKYQPLCSNPHSRPFLDLPPSEIRTPRKCPA